VDLILGSLRLKNNLIKEFSIERMIRLESELESEKEMNAILTKELNLKSE
jgi:hypothetical protein